MGRTYRGARKKFGSKKAKQHKTRSKWNARNGTRLRTLAVDLADFQEVVGTSGESLHRPPDISEKKSRKADRIVGLIVEENRPPALHTPTTVVKSRKNELASFFCSLSTKELEARKAYAARQVSHLQKLLKLMRREDSSFATAISRLEERKKHWDTRAGLIGPILVQREFALP